MEYHPFVTVIVPVRNEEKQIRKCLSSILNSDYPENRLEILVVDGMSTDRSPGIVRELQREHPNLKMFSNSGKIAPIALNIGIKNGRGEIIMRMDAHAVYPDDYISKCVKFLLETGADNVGGIWITQAGAETYIAEVIVLVLSSPYGVGNAYFRIGLKTEREVDTVPFGCYKREVFNKIGLFNERLVRNQDIEFNIRLRRSGGKILLVPNIVSYYIARSNLKDFLRNNFLNGLWNIYTIKIASTKLSLRHYIPLLFVSSIILFAIMAIFFPICQWALLLISITYVMGVLTESIRIASNKGFSYFFVLPFIFLSMHISYGLGSISGFLKPLKRK